MTGTDAPSISVIMNIQNGEAFLREAMDSVFAQDWQDWELIVWDDCSTDGSADIVRSFDDARVRYVRSPELVPLGRARQLALDEARGDWVAYLDQDDRWPTHRLRRQFEVASADPEIGFVYGRAISFYASGKQHDLDHRHEYVPLPEGDIFEALFRDACFIATSAILFRRSALATIGEVPKAIRMIPDYYMLLGVARHHRVRALDEVALYYRRHEGGMTLRYYKEIQQECLWLVHHWAEDLDPALAAHRRRVHETNVAYHEMRHWRTLVAGLGRLVRKGSLPYFLSRPLARTLRSVRRRVQRPYWQRTT